MPSAKRPLRVALVQAPAFCPYVPCPSLALLSSHLKGAGFPPFIHDASINVWSKIRRVQSIGDGAIAANPDKYSRPEWFADMCRSIPGFWESSLDEEAEKILALEPDVVGFSVISYGEEGSLGLARRIKKASPRTAIVFGGHQCLRETLAFDFISKPEVDAVALGEADRSFVEFIRAFDERRALPEASAGFLIKSEGRVADGGNPEPWEDLDALPFMDFSGFDLSLYGSECLYMTASRGCVRKCSFCTHILQQKVYKTMSAERTVAEISYQWERHPERRFIKFGDSLINGNVPRLARMSELLEDFRRSHSLAHGRDFAWGGMAILHPTMTLELLRKMRRGGCIMVNYGLETGSQHVADLMGKNFRIQQAEEIIRNTHRAGIRAYLYVMVGFPGETEEDLRETIDFVRRNAEYIYNLDVSICEIQKGSHMDRNLDGFGILAPVEDRVRWRTRDGSNTYEIRKQRYQALLDFARGIGIPMNTSPLHERPVLAAV